MISNIGGIFWLFIGISFVIIFEIAEILIEILFSLFQRNNRVEIIKDEKKRIKEEILTEVKNEIKIHLEQNYLKSLNRNFLDHKNASWRRNN